MKTVFEKTKGLTDAITHYCPGCTHGISHRIVGEVLEEFEVLGKTVGIASVGCSVMSYDYFNVDMIQAPHGRAPAVATGVKRVLPDNIVFTYQGDGDLAAIGTGEVVHAAARGENITVIFINNGTYGMTGGQMAPTTLLSQVTQTTPKGRDKHNDGFPIRVCEMLSTLEGVVYAERTALDSPKGVMQTKRAVKKAFKSQIEKKGFSIVEILSTCPTNWGLTAVESLKWVEKEMTEYYPLGVYKDKTDKGVF
ncbi:MAG: 2-oxoglutarate oxidoreductase [Oscillospiraceae bacterium]|nr:2-oxoglutarate oxidoreductase [Oscillospiraceae bacterium]